MSKRIDEIYAADAGVEDAMWHIRYDTMDDLLGAQVIMSMTILPLMTIRMTYR